MEAKTEGATLSTINDGIIEEKFQAALARIRREFDEIGRFEQKAGRVTFRIDISIDLDVYPADMSKQITGDLYVKMPKEQPVTRPIYERDGQWEVWHEPEQAGPLFPKPQAVPLRPAKAE